jgi:hypothetical protein
MTHGEKQLMNALNSNADSFDDFFESADADAPLISRKPNLQSAGKTQMTKVPGNPTFSAQFDLSFKLRYFSQDAATGKVWAGVTAAALLIAAPTLATKLVAFLFGFSDFTSGYSNAKSQFPLAVWQYDKTRVNGKDNFQENLFGSNFDAIVGSQLSPGDVVIHFIGTTPALLTYHAYMIINCTQVAYGTLLNAMASDRFVINLVRYILTDTTPAGLLQYANQIALLKLSLFGKADKDFVSPNSYKQPKDFQNGIIDIPLKKGLDKQETIATYVNYDVSDFQWSVFVWTTLKV